MNVNSVNFMAKHTKPVDQGGHGKKVAATVLGLATAGAVAGAYVLGKKSIDASELAESKAISKVAKTIVEGFKNIPKYATELFESVKGKISNLKPAEIVEEAGEAIEEAV